MSRSRRKNKIQGIITAKSEKMDKRHANRRLRRIVNLKVKSNDANIPSLREVSDVWSFGKDGKSYHSDMSENIIFKPINPKL